MGERQKRFIQKVRHVASSETSHHLVLDNSHSGELKAMQDKK
jgi:hypothetical protein